MGIYFAIAGGGERRPTTGGGDEATPRQPWRAVEGFVVGFFGQPARPNARTRLKATTQVLFIRSLLEFTVVLIGLFYAQGAAAAAPRVQGAGGNGDQAGSRMSPSAAEKRLATPPSTATVARTPRPFSRVA